MGYVLVRIILIGIGRLAAWMKRRPWLGALLVLVLLKIIATTVWHLIKLVLLLSVVAFVVLIAQRMVGGPFQKPPCHAVTLLNAQ